MADSRHIENRKLAVTSITMMITIIAVQKYQKIFKFARKTANINVKTALL